MDGLSISRDDMSVDWCSVYCEDYKYFGTEGVTCFCDNIIPPSTATNCDLSCSDGSECGGDLALSVYEQDAALYVDLPTFQGMAVYVASGGNCYKYVIGESLAQDVDDSACSANTFVAQHSLGTLSTSEGSEETYVNGDGTCNDGGGRAASVHYLASSAASAVTVVDIVESPTCYYSITLQGPANPTYASNALASTGAICFPGDALLTLEDGTPKAFRDLEVGDVVLSVDRRGNISLSPVVFLPHNPNNTPRQFDKIETASGKRLAMTRNHLLPLCDGTLVTARSLEKGACVRTVNGDETVAKVTRDLTFGGVYTAVTTNEFLVVNGVVASPFAAAHGVAHAFFDRNDAAAWCADNAALLAVAAAEDVQVHRRRLANETAGGETCVALLNSMFENYKDEGVGWGAAGFGFRNFNNLREGQKKAASSLLMKLAGWT